MKRSVYLDTTMPSYLFDKRESLSTYTNITRKWWHEESQNFEIWMSEETLAELSTGNYPQREAILEWAIQIPMLPYEPQVPGIAEIYIQNHLMPKSLGGDALHLAYASFYKIDFLMTWNCNHLANANKKQHIRVINARLNLSVPEIITPLELFTEVLDADE